MKRKFLIFCLIANLTILFVLIINLLSIVLGLESVIELINSKQFINFRMILVQTSVKLTTLCRFKLTTLC